MKKRWSLVIPAVMVTLAAGLLLAPPAAFSQVTIHINGLRQDLQKNWLQVPQNSACTVYWESSPADKESNVQISDLIEEYRVRCLAGETEKQSKTVSPAKNFIQFPGLDLGQQYAFVVDGLKGGLVVATSDTAKLVTGRVYSAQNNGDLVPWYYKYVPLSGRIPMALIGRGDVFDSATNAGKIAFHMIWWALLGGGIIWYLCLRVLNLRRIFPMSKRRLLLFKSWEGSCKYISKNFIEIEVKWRRLNELVSSHVREGIRNGAHATIEDIEMENIKFWRVNGHNVVRDLLRRIKNPKLNLTDYPVVRVIKAGLENHELGGFRWGEVSQEVDRAIENRAATEIELLRRRSFMDWLWNLGTLAPLIGLFGTATGISHAFAMLTMMHQDITQSELVRRLAGGIFEALWTTIFGLIVGIALMLLYYYYQNKLNWIYAKWEDIYVNISEKM